jgi:precorrin-6B methylase 2
LILNTVPNVNEIDWNHIWKQGATFMIGQADKATTWNRNASRWNQTQTETDFGKKVIERLKLHPYWTALDVGAGTGLLALPMAKMCKHVTALDASSEMLRYLKQNAENQGTANINYVNKLIEETTIGKDIPKHDVVVACRSMGLEQDVKTFLKKMDDAATRYAYIVWGAQERKFDIALYNALERPYEETRTHVILFNILDQMGIRANVEIFESKPTVMGYNSIDAAFTSLRERFKRMQMNRKLNPTEEKKLKRFLQTNLKQTADGKYAFKQDDYTKHALIWWDKKLNK